MSLQWTENTKPDRPGIWQMKGAHHPYWVEEPEHFGMPVSTWAFICDLPEIVDPPKWRTPTMADVGRECEFTDYEDEWHIGDLRAISPLNDGRNKYFSSTCGWKKCRILDDGQPTPSNEFWINTYDTYCHMHPSQAEADAKAYTHRLDCFKARRVE